MATDDTSNGVTDYADDADYEARLRELERQMKEVEENEKELTAKIQAECKEELDARMRLIQSQVTDSFSDRMVNMEERYRTHTSGIVATKQTEVLRANKVLREVARGLGSDWRYVFKYLMAGFPKEVIEIETEKLERIKPFMQPYKALLTWKEYKADEFDIRQLIKALEDNLKTELAFMAKEIMQSEGESLLTLANIGKGIASGAEEDLDADTEGGASGDIGENPDGIPVAERKNLSMNDGDSVEGPIGDTKLLQLSRKMGGDWLVVSKKLNLEEEEIEELKEITDETMAAFRMLWSWRDANSATRQADLVKELVTVLKECGRTDLAEVFNRESSA